MTPQQQDAYLVETLGIDGWKPGQMCQECNDAKAYAQQFRGTIGIHTEHEISPPSIRTLEGMGKLLVALWEHDVYLTFLKPKVGLNIKQVFGTATRKSLPDAVADAAFAALQGDTHATNLR